MTDDLPELPLGDQQARADRARVTQIMILLHLAPSIQEYVLFLPAGDARFIPELELRKIAREPRWDHYSFPGRLFHS